jgi:hypothetical protein
MKKSALKLAIAAAMFASTGAMAATDGTLGTSSTGSVLVQVSKGSVVQITGLTDITLGNFTDASLALAGGANGSSPACVFSSVTNYHATLSSLNGAAYTAGVPTDCSAITYLDDDGIPGCTDGDTDAVASTAPVPGTYLMGNGAGDFVTYAASINTDAADGSSMGPYVGNSTDTTCGGGSNASVGAGIGAAALTGLPDGNYSDTLTVLITPN